MSLGLSQLVSDEFCELSIVFNVCGSFCCHFDIVLLLNALTMCSGDESGDLKSSRLISFNISYIFNGFNTVVL